GIALDQQDLEALGAAAQEDHGGGLAGRGRLLRHASGRYSSAPMADATQQWMCTSCGFIYDPAEGDPDGGIPPGTAFEDIPNDWFCPVCGARKRDFEIYEP